MNTLQAQQEAGRVLNHLASMPGAHSSIELPVLKNIMLSTGGELLSAGKLRDIRSRRLAPGVYKIWTEARP